MAAGMSSTELWTTPQQIQINYTRGKYRFECVCGAKGYERDTLSQARGDARGHRAGSALRKCRAA